MYMHVYVYICVYSYMYVCVYMSVILCSLYVCIKFLLCNIMSVFKSQLTNLAFTQFKQYRNYSIISLYHNNLFLNSIFYDFLLKG